MATPTLVMTSFLLLLAFLFFLPAFSDTGVALFSDDHATLSTGQSLVNGENSVCINNDCQLDLRRADGSRWTSMRREADTKCNARINKRGEVIIRTEDGRVVDVLGDAGEVGSYALVLTPEGHLKTFGRTIWAGDLTATAATSTPYQRSRSDSEADPGYILYSSDRFIDVPESGTLLKNDKYRLILDSSDCELSVINEESRLHHLKVVNRVPTTTTTTTCEVKLTTEGELLTALNTVNPDKYGVDPVWHRVFGTGVTTVQPTEFIGALLATGELRIYPLKSRIDSNSGASRV
ncbi:hypothetical protein GW17_00011376 [Ensete ventricosum]|nr:hypothetical protein GW17_00011376 [Ensete ventricosum]